MKSEHMSQTYWYHGEAEIKKTAFFSHRSTLESKVPRI